MSSSGTAPASGAATRRVLLVTHLGRDEARKAAAGAAQRLQEAGITVLVPASEAAELALPDAVAVPDAAGAATGCEVVMVLGGDGTLLRGAELARGTGAALLGVNLGHVGFLAEAEEEDLGQVVDRVVRRSYTVEERMTLEVAVRRDGATVASSWAINDASVEKAARQKMIELVVEIDDRPLSTWGCDGVVCATPTGSTAYAFSSGGPVVWPDVQALLLVPLSAHALFARPLVVAPTSVLAVELLRRTVPAVLWCDGRRTVDLQPGDRVEFLRSAESVRLARLQTPPFTDRLVRKFDLPVAGWRGRMGRA